MKTTTRLVIGPAVAALLLGATLASSQFTERPATTTTQLNDQDVQQQQQTVFKPNEAERDAGYWQRAGKEALLEALTYKPVTSRAKNGLIFIGDGMSLSTITASRILYGQLMNMSGEEQKLSFEALPNVCLVKTYNLDQQIPDSAATATAILTGVKSNFYTLGVTGQVKLNETNCQTILDNQVDSILRQAQLGGKSTGIITNTRITHATPAAAYAHTSNRRWECDSYLPKSLGAPCKDIARQLIEDEPGKKLNVIMGGGRRCFFGPNFADPAASNKSGLRQDGRNLISQWIASKRDLNPANFAFVNSTRDLRLVDVAKTDYLLGLFSYSHMSYEELRDRGQNGEPSLNEMTEVALKILSKNPNGYLLLVEGGRIDHAHHENVAGVALRETMALSWTIQKALASVSLDDTLVAVTADHGHAMTINGLAPRGNPILGLSHFQEYSSKLPYTTLLYGNGPGHQQPRRDPSKGQNSTNSPYYVQYAAIHQDEAYHDGSDVALFAGGPFAHLFQGVQEQSYIAHVFGYSMCIGLYSNQPHCDQQSHPRNPKTPANSILLETGGKSSSASLTPSRLFSAIVSAGLSATLLYSSNHLRRPLLGAAT